MNTLPNPFELFNKTDAIKTEMKNVDNEINDTKEGFQEGANFSKNFSSNVIGSELKNTGKEIENELKYLRKPKYFILAIFIISVVLLIFVSFIYYVYQVVIYPVIEENLFTSIRQEINQNPSYFWDLIGNSFAYGRLSIFLGLWAILYFINLLVCDLILGKKEPSNIFYITTLFVFGIIGSTFVIIGNIPSLVEVFENTFGYSVINSVLYNLKEPMKIFKSRHFPNFDIPYEILITKFDLPSFYDTINSIPKKDELNNTLPSNATDLTNDFYLDYTGKDINDLNRKLLKNVFIKNNAGHFIWGYITSFVTILLTVNSMSG
jgi:hypothetical protein